MNRSLQYLLWRQRAAVSSTPGGGTSTKGGTAGGASIELQTQAGHGGGVKGVAYVSDPVHEMQPDNVEEV